MKKNVLLRLTPHPHPQAYHDLWGLLSYQAKSGIVVNYIFLTNCYFFELTQNRDWAPGDPNYMQVTLKMISSLTCSIPSL